ncbi:MAG TPA: hypothetical protein DSN98_08460 [Thermoplasmata archaeon]|jgi:hypothetical protein|nr:MAG TPA: hypothetical protein DSN98_08460 [Thermoplasmata archaeon]
MKKYLAVGIVLLFIVITYSPTVVARNNTIIQKNIFQFIDKIENKEVEINSIKSPIKLDLELSIPPIDEKQKNRFLFFSIIIKNPGDNDLQNVFWSVDMAPFYDLGFLVYPKETCSGSVEVLKPNKTFIGRVMMCGYGIIWMHLMYGVRDVVTHDKALAAVIIGPIIILLVQTFP